ncbi:MAG: DRTGG domain-containing protein [Desulfobacterales bacterium]|nr:DRTGG domain-containing protein [Desulfobacterales bacterium]MDD3949857.1 DRTGG domain-containing protein [Desulfobacterales bacterium]MDD4464137.1 DRTGG domain-containing protein [Desulfobacterales bacterium]
MAFAMKVSEIKDILKATLLSGEGQLDRKIISGGAADRMEEILSGVAEGSVLLTGLTTIDVIRTAKISGVGAVVIVRGKKPPDEVVTLAKSYDLPLLLTSYTLFASVGRLYMNGLRSYDGSW